MSPIEAETALKDMEGILQQLSQYHHLTEEQRLALHTRAGLARQRIVDILKMLKKLKKAVEEGSSPR
jgi:hypothetical protein